MKQSIMLLDQDTDFRTLTEHYLRNCGFHDISSFGDPADALEAVAQSGIPDVIIIDLELPDMSGIDFLAELTHIRKSINAIIFTALPEVLPHRCTYPVIIKSHNAFINLIQTILTSLI